MADVIYRVRRAHLRGIVALATMSVGWIAPVYLAAASENIEYILGDDRLRIKVVTNPTALLEKFGPRFDLTGMVSAVEAAGHTFVSPEGLTDEFGQDGLGLLDYDAADAGDAFGKIGVGTLCKRSMGKYSFKERYEVISYFPVEVIAVSSNAVKIQQHGALAGFAYTYTKEYRVSPGDGSLEIIYEIKNNGRTEIVINHYNHHWFKLDGLPVGPDYLLACGFPVSLAANGGFLLSENGLIPEVVALKNHYHYEARNIPVSENWFRLGIPERAIEVLSSGDYSAYGYAIYGATRGLCPEIFFRRAVMPGETLHWKRSYRVRVGSTTGAN